MGKIVYECKHEGCTCKLKKKVKAVRGTIKRTWLCAQHSKGGEMGEERREGKRKYPSYTYRKRSA